MNLSEIAAQLERDLTAIRQIIRRPAEAEFARGELTGPQRNAMQVLVRTGGLSLKELSRHLGLAHSTVSGIVDRLEKQGMVVREVNESDRRLTCITVSSIVQEFLENKLPALLAHPLTAALERATLAEREAILDGIGTLKRLLENENAHPHG